MWKKIILSAFTLITAFGILLISAFRTASVKYEFNPSNPEEVTTVLGDNTEQIDYYLPYPGKVLPDSPFWSLKSVRDRLWLKVNTNPSREAELYLLFADKRLGSSVILFEKDMDEAGLSTLTKAEKYLEEAHLKDIENRGMGYSSTDFLEKLAMASLKHYQVTKYLLNISTDGVKPGIIKSQEYSKKVFEEVRNALLDKRITPPENPFNWE